MVARLLRQYRLWMQRANTVASSFRSRLTASVGPESVATTASRRNDERTKRTVSSDLATAVNSSSSTDIQRPKTVPVHVVKIERSNPAPVFNITVEGCPEYFANGVLVHNCDALRYAIRWIDKYTQKVPRHRRPKSNRDPFSRLAPNTWY